MYHIHLLSSTQATNQTALSTGQYKNCRKYTDHMGRDQAKRWITSENCFDRTVELSKLAERMIFIQVIWQWLQDDWDA